MSSPTRVRSSRPRPISARTADVTPTAPISGSSGAAAARWKSFSSPHCSTRPDPAFSRDTNRMPNSKSDIEVQKFTDHHVITQPNPLRKVMRRMADDEIDDPVARAEKALADLSGEFRHWMEIEVERLVAAPCVVF